MVPCHSWGRQLLQAITDAFRVKRWATVSLEALLPVLTFLPVSNAHLTYVPRFACHFHALPVNCDSCSSALILVASWALLASWPSPWV